MKHYILIMVICCIIFSIEVVCANSGILNSQPVKSMDEARALAERENKWILVDFTAKWCAPCRWMDRTTFSDTNVKKAIESKFIHLRVDIDETQGFELKNFFGIKYLPTILIFNSTGQMAQRIEETITPKVMLNILGIYGNDSSVSLHKHQPNTSPNNIQQEEKIQVVYEENADPMLSPEDYLRYFQYYPGRKTYRVLTGIFYDYEVVMDHVALLRSKFKEPVNIVNEIQDGKVVFKVCLGQFFEHSEAEDFKSSVSYKLQKDCKVI